MVVFTLFVVVLVVVLAYFLGCLFVFVFIWSLVFCYEVAFHGVGRVCAGCFCVVLMGGCISVRSLSWFSGLVC